MIFNACFPFQITIIMIPMLYLSLDSHHIKLLYLKKSLLGGFESAFYEKKLQVQVIEKGQIANIDVITSALREAVTNLPQTAAKEKEITLILPQEAFYFMRTEMPIDITQTVLSSYIKEKARTELNINVDDCLYDSMIMENENKKQLILYAIDKKTAESFQQPFVLLDMQVSSIMPETLAYFKLIEKTLRKDKKENIFFVNYEKERLIGYMYDSFGLLDKDKWVHELKEKDDVEEILKQKAVEYELGNKKLNRLILSGSESEVVRQDTFTKKVGVWTNPLKRIIPNFYQDYVKMLQPTDEKPLPVLEYDTCIGAFIFAQDNTTFSLSPKSQKKSAPSISAPAMPKLPLKLAAIFIGSFLLAFGILFLLSRMNLGTMKLAMPAILSKFAKASPTPSPSPTPVAPTPTKAPEVDRSKVRVKILNGSGISGKASVVKTALNKKGYEEILTGNADSFDYDVTEIQIKKDKTAQLKSVIEKDLSENVDKPKFTELNEDEAADIVIIVGTDFK